MAEECKLSKEDADKLKGIIDSITVKDIPEEKADKEATEEKADEKADAEADKPAKEPETKEED